MTDDEHQRGSAPPAVGGGLNPSLRPRRRATPSADVFVGGISGGDRALLARAITLVESTRPEDRALAETIVQGCLERATPSVRVGVTGVPGAGKSTFIEALGTRLLARGHRLAVLAVDPSSARSGGSILGDKTRMEELARDDRAFVRPSPTGGTLGGVARATREAVVLCEAAGFDVVLVETVGVGQSETAVRHLVDAALLLVLAGGGDELQGIKRGIMETADVVAVAKADGANAAAARSARGQYRSALSLFPPDDTGWRPPVLTCSAATGDGLDDVWSALQAYVDHLRAHGAFERRRRAQARHWLREAIDAALRADFAAHPAVADALADEEAAVTDGRTSPFAAAHRLLARYRGARGGA